MASVEATKRALVAAARAMDELPYDADVSSVSVDIGPGGHPHIGYRVRTPLGPTPEEAAQAAADEAHDREHEWRRRAATPYSGGTGGDPKLMTEGEKAASEHFDKKPDDPTSRNAHMEH